MSFHLKQIPILLNDLRYREQWVTNRGGRIFSILVAIITYAVVNQINTLNSNSPLLFSLLSLPLSWSIWFCLRAIYLRFGRRSKIGITYEGHRVPLDDWCYTRNKLYQLFKDGTLRKRVSLRLLPEKFCNSDLKRQNARDKYGYRLILKVVCSPNLNGIDIPTLSVSLDAINKEKLDKEFKDATNEHSLALINRTSKANNVQQALTMNANSLFDILLLNLGVLEAIDGQPDVGSECMRLLDSRIKDRFKIDEYPRKAIRWMDFRCLTTQSHYAGGSPPGPDSLNEAIDKCQIAIDSYLDEYPELYHIQARNLYFANRIDEALPLATKALETAGHPYAKAIATLSLAVLHLLRAEFTTATNFFRDFFELKQTSKFNWKDLIEFADCSRDFGYEHAVFIQALYRKIDGSALDIQLENEVSDWLDADESRLQLLKIYKQQPRTSQQKNSKKKKKGQTAVKRKKRRKKRKR